VAQRLVAALAREADDTGAAALAGSTRYVYALTHVVIARSGWFRTRVEPGGLEFAVPILRAAVEQRLEQTHDVFALDLMAEAVACLALLGEDGDAAVRQARERIVAAQHEDGSWGGGEGVTPRRIHPTFNAIVALLELSELGGASPGETQ
jgi:hypothetical protein